MKRLLITFCITLALALSTSPIQAEEITPETITTETTQTTSTTSTPETTETVTVAQDEVTAEDLGVAEPSVLPGSFFYPFKRFSERVQEVLTFNPQSRAILSERLANKRLVEARALAKAGKSEEAVEILEDYKTRMEAAQERLNSIDRSTLSTDEQAKLDKLSDRVTANLLKQQAVLERVEDQVPEQAKERIRDNIERAQKRVEERLSKLPTEKQEEIKERLEAIIEDLPKDELSRSEMIKKLGEVRAEVVPAAITEKIKEQEATQLKRVEEAIASGKITAEEAAEHTEKIKERAEEKIKHVEEKAEEMKKKIDERADEMKEKNEEKLKKLEERAKAIPDDVKLPAPKVLDPERAEEIRKKTQDALNALKKPTPRPGPGTGDTEQEAR